MYFAFFSICTVGSQKLLTGEDDLNSGYADSFKIMIGINLPGSKSGTFDNPHNYLYYYNKQFLLRRYNKSVPVLTVFLY